MGCLYKRKSVWYAKYRDENGREVYKSLKCTDQSIARSKLVELERQVQHAAAGFSNQFTKANQIPLALHLIEYKTHLENSGRCEKHINSTIKQITKIIAGCKFDRLNDLRPQPIKNWLAKKRKDNKRFGYRTSNAYAKSIKGFSRWLWINEKTVEHKLVNLDTLNIDCDLRHQRRSLSISEIDLLLQTTKKSGSIQQHLNGETRYYLYLTAILTGLRASEIVSLTPFNFDFSAGYFSIAATNTKAKKSATLPIHARLRIELKNWIEARGLKSHDRIFNFQNLEWSELVKFDLQAAGIPYCVDDRYFDFHSLRGQYATLLDASGASPKEIQDLLRVSDLALVARYCRPSLFALENSLARIDLTPPVVGDLVGQNIQSQY